MLEEKPEYKKRKNIYEKTPASYQTVILYRSGSRCCYHRLCNMGIKV